MVRVQSDRMVKDMETKRVNSNSFFSGKIQKTLVMDWRSGLNRKETLWDRELKSLLF